MGSEALFFAPGSLPKGFNKELEIGLRSSCV